MRKCSLSGFEWNRESNEAQVHFIVKLDCIFYVFHFVPTTAINAVLIS